MWLPFWTSYFTPRVRRSRTVWTLEWRRSESCTVMWCSHSRRKCDFFLFLVNLSSIDCLIYFHLESRRLPFPWGLWNEFMDVQGQVEDEPSEQLTWRYSDLGLRDPRLLVTVWAPESKRGTSFFLQPWSLLKTLPSAHISGDSGPFLGHFARNLHLGRIFYKVKTLIISVHFFLLPSWIGKEWFCKIFDKMTEQMITYYRYWKIF